MTPYILVRPYRRFERIYWFHLLHRRQYVTADCRCLTAKWRHVSFIDVKGCCPLLRLLCVTKDVMISEWCIVKDVEGSCRGFVLLHNSSVVLMNGRKWSFKVADLHPRLAPGSHWIRSRGFVYTSAIFGSDVGDHCEPSASRKPKISCSAQCSLETCRLYSGTECALLWVSFFLVAVGGVVDFAVFIYYAILLIRSKLEWFRVGNYAGLYSRPHLYGFLHHFHFTFDICVTLHHWYNNINSQLYPTIIILLIITIALTCFGRLFRPSSGALDGLYSLWYNALTMQSACEMD